jgi:hypothetical protein
MPNAQTEITKPPSADDPLLKDIVRRLVGVLIGDN